jgi:hypothetical protein
MARPGEHRHGRKEIILVMGHFHSSAICIERRSFHLSAALSRSF